MSIPFLFLPFILSAITGYLLLVRLFGRDTRPPKMLTAAFSCGLGLGLSAVFTFLSFLLLNAFRPGFVVALHILALFALGLIFFTDKQRIQPLCISRQETLIFALLGVAMIPIWLEAKFYPLGGWDAWSVWNYKAKFLFLAGEDWRNLFAPFLWQSSPHYPLLLPLMNVWGWTFSTAPVPFVPFFTALLFTFLTALLLYGAIHDLTQNPWAILAPLLLLSLPFYATLATSQYCDVVIGFYLLAALFCLLKTCKNHNRGYSALAGIFLGLLSFTKPEGAVVVLVTVFVFTVFWFTAKTEKPTKARLFLVFWVSLVVSSFPTLLFEAALSPGNQTFVNGFRSLEKPVTWARLETIPVFLLIELITQKWNGLCLLIITGAVIFGRKNFRKEILLVPLVLALYLGVIFFYYLLNTYFKIEWWLQVTLSRILFSLLPTALFWIFSALQEDSGNNPN